MSSPSLDLVFTSATEQARLIREGQISPLELTELYLSRIATLDPQLGSFFHVARDSAIADARQKTELLAKAKDGKNLPPFFGVPIGIKDLKPVAGLPISYGVSALKENIASYDDGVITKIKQAGFTILGKTATSQLGSFPYTEPPGFAPTRNPWNLDYTPGGSSGGSASAVSAGLSPVALGGDAGGSIRGPAFCCGLVGIKPSRGRVSHAPAGDILNGIATTGILSRNVADAAAVLDVISGYITGDPYWLNAPGASFLAATKQQLSQLKIGLLAEIHPAGTPSPECMGSVKAIAKLLESMGHAIEPQSLDLTELIDPFKSIWASGVAFSGIDPEILSPMNQWVLSLSGTAGAYLQAVSKMQVIARKIVSLSAKFDVLIAPTYMHPAIKIGEWQDLDPEKTLAKIIDWILPCPPFNATGQPVINIPTGFDANGVPLGIQIIGKPTDEATIIAIASQIETAKPWSQLRPKFAT